jgi:branched-chain amino acid transport system ATP-binding protein
MAELVLADVSLAFGGLQVLRGVSLEARAGELLALIGPNGAGKTSVLNCISGLYRPQRGSIRFGGRDLTAMKTHEIAAAGVGRTFQHGELFPHMSVLENLLVARHARTASRLFADALFAGTAQRAELEHRRRAEEILEFVELERWRHHAVDTLPFGVQKIVGFARALAAEPKVLLLDEPSAGLNREE